jgi:hypothetical protein
MFWMVWFQVLDYYDGFKRNGVVIYRIQSELNSTPDPELLLSLYQNRVLIDGEKP